MAERTTPRPIPRNASQVEAASRALVALVFQLALFLDPAEPVRDDLAGAVVLTAFLAWSLVLIAIAWRSWWWDHRLAGPAHVIDIAVFMAAVYYTETPSIDFASPFMAFAVLLLVKARVRWNWRATVWTALILIALYVLMGFAIARAGYAIDAYRFGRRAAYMLLLAIVLGWMGVERRVRLALPFPSLMPLLPSRADVASPSEPALGPLMSAACAFARSATGAQDVAIAWSAEEEPWTDLAIDQAGTPLRLERLGPDLLAPSSLDPAWPLTAMLFDAPRRRALAALPESQRAALRPARATAFAAHLGVDVGIIAPIESDAGAGQLLVWTLADPSFDKVQLAVQAAEEIGRAFERDERARFAQRIAVSGAISAVREAVARDLHDSAAQFLAGSMFRLEALRRQIDDRDGLAAEIVEIKDAMRLEQVELRALIGQLRDKAPLAGLDRRIDIVSEVGTLLGELETRWQVRVTLDAAAEPITVPAPLAHEIRQLIRESVANAARHGGCDAVVVALAAGRDTLTLTVCDNGRGFALDADGNPVRPRSIAGRVAALGGSLAIAPADPGADAPGARLTIELRLRGAARAAMPAYFDAGALATGLAP